MYTIEKQKELDLLLRSDGYSDYNEDIGIDLFEDNIILLDGDYFIFDCSCKLFESYPDIIFVGNKSTKVKLINCEKNNSALFNNYDEIVSSFIYANNIIFHNVIITAEELTEIAFSDKEEFYKWKGVKYDNFMIRVIIDEEENDKFFEMLNGYNVEGILEKGDHLVVGRGIYTHHGIYIGNNKVIHYHGDIGYEGEIIETSLEFFVRGDTFWVYDHEYNLERDEIVRRAKNRLNEKDYDLFFNNCEHFAYWCCTGETWSHQSVFGVIWGNIANDGGVQKYRLKY